MSKMLEVSNVLMARILEVQIKFRNVAIQLKHNNETDSGDGLMFKLFKDSQLYLERIIKHYSNQNYTILRLYHTHLRATEPTVENENFQSVCLQTIKQVMPEFNRKLLIHCKKWGCTIDDYLNNFRNLVQSIVYALDEFEKILRVLDEDLSFHYRECCKNTPNIDIMPINSSTEYLQTLMSLLQQQIDIVSQPNKIVEFKTKLKDKFETFEKLKPLDTYLWWYLQNNSKLYGDDMAINSSKETSSKTETTNELYNTSNDSSSSSSTDSCYKKVCQNSKVISKKKIKKVKSVNLDLNEKPVCNKSIRVIYYSRSRCYICLELQFNFNFTMSTDCQHCFCKSCINTMYKHQQFLNYARKTIEGCGKQPFSIPCPICRTQINSHSFYSLQFNPVAQFYDYYFEKYCIPLLNLPALPASETVN